MAHVDATFSPGGKVELREVLVPLVVQFRQQDTRAHGLKVSDCIRLVCRELTGLEPAADRIPSLVTAVRDAEYEAQLPPGRKPPVGAGNSHYVPPDMLPGQEIALKQLEDRSTDRM